MSKESEINPTYNELRHEKAIQIYREGLDEKTLYEYAHDNMSNETVQTYIESADNRHNSNTTK